MWIIVRIPLSMTDEVSCLRETEPIALLLASSCILCF